MSEFGNELYDYPLIDEEIDFDKYKSPLRRIRRVFPRATKEIQTLVINLAHNKECAVYYKCFKLSRYHMTKAIKLLLSNGYIEVLRDRWHNPSGLGTSRVYQRTALFENTFKFRLPKRTVVKASALVRPVNENVINLSPNNVRSPNPVRTTVPANSSNSINSNSSNNSINVIKHINIIPSSTPANASTSPNAAILGSQNGTGLIYYESLAKTTEITLSNGGQVFRHIWLFRKQARLFQRGSHNYQQLSPKERKYLLINGEPTVELDYESLHPNLLLNRSGQPCSHDFYRTILRELGIKAYKNKRNALKLITLVAINTDAVRGFYSYCGKIPYRKGKRKGQKVLPDLGVRPIRIYEAYIKKYPTLKNSIAQGKQALSLQREDSEIMIDVLETLAKRGIIALPVHDSIIVPDKHKALAKRVMENTYKSHTKYDINVK